MSVVLAYRALGLGDLLAGVPALRGLRRAFGDDLVVATPAPLHPLLALAGLRGVACAPLTAPRLDDAPRLAVNLHGRGPESHEVLRSLAPGTLWGFDLPGQPPWPGHVHERTRWCDLLRHHGVDADPADLRLPAPAPTEHAGKVVVHAGAAAPSRRWPHWAAVARELATDHRVVATAGPGEPGLPGVETWRGPVDELAAVVAHARLLLSADTGVAHLAPAFGTPSVTLFGPVPPDEWGPPAGGPHEVLWAGRRGDPHGQTLDPGLAAIGVDAVLSAAARAARRS